MNFHYRLTCTRHAMYIALALSRISPTLSMTVKILTQTLSLIAVPRVLRILRVISLKYHARNNLISLIFFSIINLTDINKNHTVFWDMMPCSFCRSLSRFRRNIFHPSSERAEPYLQHSRYRDNLTFTVYKEIIRPKSPL